MTEMFLNNGWIVLALPGIFGLIGAFMADPKSPDTPETGRISPFFVWAWGSFIILGMAFVITVFGAGASCVSQETTSGNKMWNSCPETIGRWNIVLEDWQSAIGAILGLFGVAWSTYYKTVYGRA
ncbi:MAG: hypothetical protein AAGD13_09905 [Pseudomonadota bacterium]